MYGTTNSIPSSLLPAHHQETVFVGTVRAVASTPRTSSAEVEVEYYLCGCGPSQVIVNGLHSTSTCGPGVPRAGERRIFFTCHGIDGATTFDASSHHVHINDFTLHTGMSQVILCPALLRGHVGNVR